MVVSIYFVSNSPVYSIFRFRSFHQNAKHEYTTQRRSAFNQMYWHHIKTVFQFDTENLNSVHLLLLLLVAVDDALNRRSPRLNASIQFAEGFDFIFALSFGCVCICLASIFVHNNILNLIINSLIEACITSSLTKFYRHDIQFIFRRLSSVR